MLAKLPERTDKNARSAEERLVRTKKGERKKKRPVFGFVHGGRTGYPLELTKRQKCFALYKKRREKNEKVRVTPAAKEIAHEYCSQAGWNSVQSRPFIIKEDKQIKGSGGSFMRGDFNNAFINCA